MGVPPPPMLKIGENEMKRIKKSRKKINQEKKKPTKFKTYITYGTLSCGNWKLGLNLNFEQVVKD